jgi:hypothetical protein
VFRFEYFTSVSQCRNRDPQGAVNVIAGVAEKWDDNKVASLILVPKTTLNLKHTV